MKTIKFISTLLLLIGFPLLMTSCTSDNDTGHNNGRNRESRKPENVLTFKYKVGDIIYLKPDSVKAVIEKLNLHQPLCGCDDGPTYKIYFFNKLNDRITEPAFKEELIY